MPCPCVRKIAFLAVFATFCLALAAIGGLFAPTAAAIGTDGDTYVDGSLRLTIPEMPAAVTADGVVTADEWGQPLFTLNKDYLLNQGNGRIWTNSDPYTGIPVTAPDIDADVYMGWEPGYFDFALVFNNHKNVNTDTSDPDMWYQDCLQMQIAAVPETGERYEWCFAQNSDTGKDAACQFFPTEYNGVPIPDNDYCVKDNGSATVYELHIPVGAYSGNTLSAGSQIPFSFSLHYYDPVGDTSDFIPGYFYEWASGTIGGTAEKTIASAAVLTMDPASTGTAALGDVNNDGKIDTTDARLVLQSIVNKYILSDTQKMSADVNGDEKIDTVDARMILQYIVHKLDKFPADK